MSDAGKLKLAVLISGRGSNLEALIGACAKPGYPAQIVLVLSNKADAMGLELAAGAGIPANAISHKEYPDRAAFDAEITRAIEASGADLICLAGFMRLLSDEFVDHWRNRLINIHPGLLPSFKGLDVPRRVLESGAKFAGCTVHYVRKEMDTGPIIIQAAVPVLVEDDEDSLAARVLAQEHVIYPLAVRWIAEGRVEILDENRTRIKGAQSEAQSAVGFEAGALVNP